MFVLLPFWGSSQTLELIANTESYPITPVAGLYTDASGQLPLTQVQKKNFTVTRKKGLLFPFSNAAVWLKITLKNHNPQRKQWVLAWDNPMAEEIDFYISGQKGIDGVKKTGAVVTGNRILMAENKPFFSFDLDYQATKTIYIRVKGQRAHFASALLFSEPAFHRYDSIQNNLYGFMSGAIAIRLFYVFLLALFAVKDHDFRQYSVLLVARSIAFWGMHGILSNFFPNPTTGLTVTFLSFHILPLGLMVAFQVIFPGKRFPKWVDRIFLLIAVVNIAMVAAVFFGYRWQLILASTYLTIFTQVFILAMYLYAIVKKYPINWNYSIAYLLGLGSYIFVQMRLVGWVDYAWISPVALLFFTLEFLVFGYFLGRIVIDYERNRASTEQELSFTKKQALKVQELDRLKTRFFTNISHEFRTPLTLLTGPLEEIRKKYPQEGLVPMMQRNVSRLQSLINQLLDLSKLEAGELKVALREGDMAVYIQQLTASFESLAQNKRIIFHTEQSHLSFVSVFDEDKVEKILVNLLSNAFKFTPEGGRIKVRADYSALFMTLKVQDWGIGIEAERLPRIFDRFYQVQTDTQRHYEGTGIGLALVKELIDVLNGKISVESQAGKGTVFTVVLPLVPVSTHSSPEKELPQPRSVLNGKNHDTPPALFERETSVKRRDSTQETELPLLLVVEDNPDLRAYIRSIFEASYQIMEASDGEEGLQKAFEHVPDVVVCDLMMPRLDGLGFCKELKTDIRTNHIPVVMLTAKATPDDRIEGFKLGADEYLSKPFNREELEIRVRNLLLQRQALRLKYAHQRPEAEAVGSIEKVYSLDEQFLLKAHQIVENHLGDSSFDVDRFCREMGMSRTNLHRKLKALAETSTTEFIRNIRLQQAATLLHQRAGTVSEIAYRVGFESLPYFSKSFQDRFGVPPSEWASGAGVSPAS